MSYHCTTSLQDGRCTGNSPVGVTHMEIYCHLVDMYEHGNT